MTSPRRGLTLCALVAITASACGSDTSASPGATDPVGTSAPSPPPASIEAPTSTTTTTTTSLPVSAPSTTVVFDQCLRSLPFTPTYLPEGFDAQLRPGNGGEVGIAPDGTIHAFEPPDPYYVNYSAHAFRLGTFINIVAGTGETSATYESMTVLGRPAQFGDIEDGYVVVFHTGDSECDQYTMMTYGVSPEDTRRVAEGLVATSRDGVQDSVHLAGWVVTCQLPAHSSAQPFPGPDATPEWAAHKRFYIEGCCSVIVTLQTITPLMYPPDLIESWSTGPTQWSLYTIEGPQRDVMAVAQIAGISVLVWASNNSSEMAKQLAATIVVTPPDQSPTTTSP